ncbi:retrovirus-related pol polyprotein from transposon TNT 1-94 [Tanacetum coccineum]
MTRQCTKPKRQRNSKWLKEKMLLPQAIESGVVLDEEHMAFLAEMGTHAVLMAKLFAYDSNVLLEVPTHETYQTNNVIDQSVQDMQYSEQPPFINASDIDITSDCNVISYDQYLKETKNERKYFEIEKKELFIENDRLLEHIICQDVMCIAMHAVLDNKYYLKKTKEHADILRDTVEQARAQKSLDSALDYACKFTTCIQQLLVYVSATCPSSLNKNEKSVADTPMNKRKKVRLEEPKKSIIVKSFTSASGSQPSGNTKKNRISRTTSSNKKNKVDDHLRRVKSSLNKKNRVFECNASTKQDVLKENSKSVCKTCNECLFNTCHDLCVVDYLNNVNVHAKSRSNSNKKKVWKPTGKVFTIVKHRWIPTGRTFTIDRNKYPLTRITSTIVVPPKKLVLAKIVKKSPPSRNNPGKPKAKNQYNETEFVNQTLKSYYEDVRISNQTSVTCTPHQNGIVKRRNQTLVEAARTMLIFSKAPLFLTRSKPFFLNTLCSTNYERLGYPLPTNVDEYFYPPSVVSRAPSTAAVALIPVDTTSTPSSTSVDQDAQYANNSLTLEDSYEPVLHQDVEEKEPPNA